MDLRRNLRDDRRPPAEPQRARAIRSQREPACMASTRDIFEPSNARRQSALALAEYAGDAAWLPPECWYG